MARLFNLSLEETIAESEGIVTAKPQDEISAIENAAAAGTEEVEIENTSAEVSEAMEEAEALGEQVAVNEEVLASTSGDEGISESQVVEAQESLKYALACFGSRAGYVDQVRVSTESARYMSRRQRLKVATEESKNFIQKLIEAAKRLIKKIYVKIAAWVRKIIVKIANYNKAIDNVYDRLNAIKPEAIDERSFADDINQNHKTYDMFSWLTSGKLVSIALSKFNTAASVLISSLKAQTPEALRNATSIKAISGLYDRNLVLENIENKFFKYDGDDDDVTTGVIVCATGKSVLKITSKGFKKFNYENSDEDFTDFSAFNAYKTFIECKTAVKKAVDNVGPIFKGLQKVQDASLKEVEDTEKEVKQNSQDSDTIKEAGLKVNTAKSVSVTAVMFFMNAYVNTIKTYIQMGRCLIDAKKS